MLFARFVSFLLRIAHDNALRSSKSAHGKVNGTTNEKSAEALLFDQIEVLSAQILKKKEKDERKKRRAQKKKAKAKAENGYVVKASTKISTTYS